MSIRKYGVEPAEIEVVDNDADKTTESVQNQEQTNEES